MLAWASETLPPEPSTKNKGHWMSLSKVAIYGCFSGISPEKAAVYCKLPILGSPDFHTLWARAEPSGSEGLHNKTSCGLDLSGGVCLDDHPKVDFCFPFSADGCEIHVDHRSETLGISWNDSVPPANANKRCGFSRGFLGGAKWTSSIQQDATDWNARGSVSVAGHLPANTCGT